jgi:hypothetical protein
MDGRQDPFPPALVLEHIEMEHGRLDYGDVFKRHGIRCAYLPTLSPTAGRLTENGWATLYKDEDWMVLRDSVAQE